MPEPSLFLGMVTHPRSRFNVDGAATHRLEALAAAAAAHGPVAGTLVSDRNDYSPSVDPLSRTTLVKSAWHQARLEYRWRRYLRSGGDGVARDTAVLAAMGLRRGADALAGSWSDRHDQRSGRRAAVRLINIDLSHLRVMDAARASGAGWTLVLEDDAGTPDPLEAMSAVATVIERLDATPVQFACLSTSISTADLGVEGLLSPVPGPPLAGGRTLLAADRPVTNTVCANLYRTTFLERLQADIRQRGLVPVVPIDWRLNEAILSMTAEGSLGAGSCVWIEPGIFVQRSMHGSIEE